MTIRTRTDFVASADNLATQAGVDIFARGGNAVDAALAANAVLTVTAPHMCGLGGDLFALVADASGEIHALNASGICAGGIDAAGLRDRGLDAVPLRHDLAAVTVPGCVDGWIELHTRFGHLALPEILAPAIGYATDGFPASPLLVASLRLLDRRGAEALGELVAQATTPGAVVRRPGMARTLAAIACDGRAAFYTGEFGAGLRALDPTQFLAADLEALQAEWVEPLTTSSLGIEISTIGPNSQGYLIPAALDIAAALDLPRDPDDWRWAHLLIEACSAAAHDRVAVLHDRADGAALIERARSRYTSIDRARAAPWPVPVDDGDTTYLCTADRSLLVSLIQSNASGFGAWIVEPSTQINLHNRGLGFSLRPGHPAELSPGRRPPHTLSPTIVRRGGTNPVRAAVGTMGGDAQPQILSQLLWRLFVDGQTPGTVVDAPRWVLRGPQTGFDTWDPGSRPTVVIEEHAPSGWSTGLSAAGHRISTGPSWDSGFGHAHLVIDDGEVFAGAADRRARIGAAGGR